VRQLVAGYWPLPLELWSVNRREEPEGAVPLAPGTPGDPEAPAGPEAPTGPEAPWDCGELRTTTVEGADGALGALTVTLGAGAATV